jgi:hypothetical protein
MTAYHHVDLDDLRHRLRQQVRHVALAILGKPNITTCSEWRWGRKGSLALAITGPKQGFWHDHECGGGGDLFDLIQRVRGGDFVSAIDVAVDIVGGVSAKTPLRVNTAKPQDDDRSRRLNALRIWNESRSIIGTLAATYLESRAIDIGQLPDLDETLRSHPNCRFGDGRFPCLIALMRNVATNEPAGIIRTAISASAEKLGRKMLGRKQGAAIKLWPDATVSIALVIGEGLETVAAAATRIEYRGTRLQPAWALCDAANLATFAPLSGIECLSILTDRDGPRCDSKKLGYAGQRAAQACARRWLASGARVEILLPHRFGADFADLAAEVAA